MELIVCWVLMVMVVVVGGWAPLVRLLLVTCGEEAFQLVKRFCDVLYDLVLRLGLVIGRVLLDHEAEHWRRCLRSSRVFRRQHRRNHPEL